MSTRRSGAIAAAVIAGAAAGLGGATAGDAKTRTTSVGIGEREFRISVYRKHILPGKVRFNIENFGEDVHDLRVIGPGETTTIRGTSPEVKAGQRYTLKVKLKRRGLYRLVCTLVDHEAQGMIARIRVVRRLK